jgi:hypothetical protein
MIIVIIEQCFWFLVLLGAFYMIIGFLAVVTFMVASIIGTKAEKEMNEIIDKDKLVASTEEVMEIRYESDEDGFCRTKCLLNNDINDVKVGSYTCQEECPCYKGADRENKIVFCLYKKG